VTAVEHLPLIRPEVLPAAADEIVIEADWTARRDGYGRTQFFAYWWPGRFWLPSEPSAQCFHASPERYAEQWEAEGKSVRVEQMQP